MNKKHHVEFLGTNWNEADLESFLDDRAESGYQLTIIAPMNTMRWYGERMPTEQRVLAFIFEKGATDD